MSVFFSCSDFQWAQIVAIVGHNLHPVAQNRHTSRVFSSPIGQYRSIECGCTFWRPCMCNCMSIHRRFLKSCYLYHPASSLCGSIDPICECKRMWSARCRRRDFISYRQQSDFDAKDLLCRLIMQKRRKHAFKMAEHGVATQWCVFKND